MFGNILIDKLRISLKLDGVFDPYNAKKILDNVMSKHFRKSNYTVNYDKSYFRVTFTPTLYLDEVREEDEEKYTPIFNMQMPKLLKFLFLLKQIYEVLGDNATITWIDIAKDIITPLDANKYIKELSKWKPKYPYNKSEYTSKTNKYVTLTLSPRKRKNVIDCKNKNRVMTFYSKASEIEAKTKGNTRFINNVTLSEEEKELFSREDCNVEYNAENGRLFFHDLNLLRCEQRYKYSNNIKRITHVLTDSKDVDKLTLRLLIELLRKDELYKKLDEFYTEELRKYVFYHDINEDKDINLNKHEEIVKDCVIEYDLDITDYQCLFEEFGFKDKFLYSMKKVLYRSISDYYRDLYRKYEI